MLPFRQDMESAFRNSPKLWSPAQDQAQRTSKHFNRQDELDSVGYQRRKKRKEGEKNVLEWGVGQEG